MAGFPPGVGVLSPGSQGGDGPNERDLRPRARTTGGPSGRTKSLRAGAISLAAGCSGVYRLDASAVYPGLGVQPGVALPTLRQGGARADQVARLRRFLRGPDVLQHSDQ